MKKRLLLLSLLASMSLTGCDLLNEVMDKISPQSSENQTNEGENTPGQEEVKPGEEEDPPVTPVTPPSGEDEDPPVTPVTPPSGEDDDPPVTPVTPPSGEDDEQTVSPEVEEYYKNISTTATGNTLKTQLYNLIKGHTKYNYNSLEVAMKVTDRDYELDPLQNNESEDYDPYMRLLYADYNGDKSTAKKWSTSQGSFGTLSNYVWNKEHIWAKANGFGKASSCEAYSDLHHLRASDWKCNNTRSNYPFGNVAHHNSSTASLDYTSSRSTDNYLENKVFEPRDSDKGDVARALFYMATRYMNGDGSNNTNLTLTTGTDSSNGKWGYLNTLLQWNIQDPPDAFEINRNGLVQTFQKNRNPYIDHPEWAQKVFG